MDVCSDSFFVAAYALLCKFVYAVRAEKIRECDQYICKLHKKTRKLSMKNVHIATLAHEIRNFVTK